MNKMDKNKLPINKFLKLITQKKIMFSNEQWFKMPEGTIMFPREKGA
jgi:hypothetical protein